MTPSSQEMESPEIPVRFIPARAPLFTGPQKKPESDLTDSFEVRRFIDEWIGFYNTEMPHLALDGKTPAEAYRGNPPVDRMDKLLRALPTPPQAQRQRQEDLAKERSWRYE